MLAFKTSNHELNKVLSNYFDILIDNYSYDNKKNMLVDNIKSYGEQCTKEHFTQVNDYYDDFKLDEALCILKDKNYGLQNDETFFQGLKVRFIYCSNTKAGCIDLRVE